MHKLILEDAEKIVRLTDFSWLDNKKVLITGASGLIGLYLISTLQSLKKKYNIKIYAWVKNNIDENVKLIFQDCEIIQEDITDSNVFDYLPKFDCIIHSAGYGQPGKFLENKMKTLEINTNSTTQLLKKLQSNGKFLFISTSEIYSGNDLENVDENSVGGTNTNHPRACYIEGKRAGETICYLYEEIGVDVKIARLSLAYGPGTKVKDHRVLNSLIEKGLNEPTINLLDNGEAIRTYCYITDVIEMFWNILLHGKQILYNVGGVDKVSILELANKIGDKLEKKVILSSKENYLSGSPKVVNMSIIQYLNEFGKQNFITLDEGLTNTINWQKKLYDV